MTKPDGWMTMISFLSCVLISITAGSCLTSIGYKSASGGFDFEFHLCDGITANIMKKILSLGSTKELAKFIDLCRHCINIITILCSVTLWWFISMNRKSQYSFRSWLYLLICMFFMCFANMISTVTFQLLFHKTFIFEEIGTMHFISNGFKNEINSQIYLIIALICQFICAWKQRKNKNSQFDMDVTHRECEGILGKADIPQIMGVQKSGDIPEPYQKNIGDIKAKDKLLENKGKVKNALNLLNKMKLLLESNIQFIRNILQFAFAFMFGLLAFIWAILSFNESWISYRPIKFPITHSGLTLNGQLSGQCPSDLVNLATTINRESKGILKLFSSGLKSMPAEFVETG